MRISSGVTSYLYDANRQAVQRRGPDELASDTQKTQLLEGQREEKINPPVEQVVEGEVIDGYYDAQADNVLKFSQTHPHEEDQEAFPQDRLSSKANHALTQYQAIDLVEDPMSVLMQGQRIDFYV